MTQTPDVSCRGHEQAVRDEGPIRILIVDDNQDLARSMSMLLAHYGFAVATAPDGMTAIEEARSFRPAVILLDIGLPDMNGYDVADTLRAHLGLGDARFIAISAVDSRSSHGPSSNTFEHYLVKPVDFEFLLLLLNEASP